MPAAATAGPAAPPPDGSSDAYCRSLLAWAGQDPASTVSELDRLLKTDSILLRRIAIHCLIVHPTLIKLLRGSLVTSETLEEHEYHHEISTLVERCFEYLDDRSIKTIHEFIRKGPRGLISVPEPKANHQLDTHRWLWLTLVPSQHQTAEERAWREELRQTQETPEHPHFIFWSGDMIFDSEEDMPKSPDKDRIRIAWQGGGAAALTNELRELEGWWTGLDDLVNDDPIGVLQLAPLLEPKDGRGLDAYFQSYQKLLSGGNAPPFDWTPLIELMERLAATVTQLPDTCASEMGRLVSEGLAGKENLIPFDLLARTSEVMAILIDRFAQPLDLDPDLGGRIDRHHQLNHPAGVAADAFMQCLWRYLFLTADSEREIPENTKARILSSVESGWGGLEMRHALGEFWFVLDWGEHGWLEAHSKQLWPDNLSQATTNARRAFLLGFLKADQWSRKPLTAIQPMFVDGIRDLAQDEPEYLDRSGSSDRFIQHLVYGWLYEVDGYNFDGLMGDFVRIVPDTHRTRFVWLFGRTYWQGSGGPDFAKTVARRSEYWKRRVNDFGNDLPINVASEELSAFCAWAKDLGFTVRALEPRLEVSIDHLSEGMYARELFEFFALRGELEPLPTLRLTNRLIDRLHTDDKLPLWKHHSPELDATLDAICRGAKSSHRSLIRQLANTLSRAGLQVQASRLEHCGK